MAKRATVTVNVVQLTVKTVELTVKVLRQIPTLSYHEVRPLLDSKGEFQEGAVLGWIHGSVLDCDDNWRQWLLVKLGEGRYGRFDAMPQTCQKFPQLIIG